MTFSEFFAGNPARYLEPHPATALELLGPLAAGSWIDEPGSRPGVDLGTWIGEPQETVAWALLARAREELPSIGVSVESATLALYAAEGSDWFWWLGRDQDSASDQDFDDLFRAHLRTAYRDGGRPTPPELEHHIVRHMVAWSHVAPTHEMQQGDDLIMATTCPGSLVWRYDSGVVQHSPLFRAGGAAGGVGRHQLSLGAVPQASQTVEFRFHCAHEGCGEGSPCQDVSWHRVLVRPTQKALRGPVSTG